MSDADAGVDDVTLYCDGSCLGNPGPGGYAALLVVNKGGQKHEKLVSGGAALTTNNKMELQAAVSGLQILTRPCRVLVVTDSNYVVQGMKSWIHGWKKNAWRTSSKKPVENRELWEALDAAAAKHQVQWQWVKGHAGHPENERVDVAARAEATRMQAGGA